MRVLQINSFFSSGGPPRIVNGIYDILIANGHECKIAAAREQVQHCSDSIIIGNRMDTYKNAVQARLLDNDGFAAKTATKRLISQIEQYSPDIIQLHNLHGYYLNIPLLFTFLKKSQVPVVWTLHDCWAMTGHCTHFDYIGCDKWQKGQCGKCPQKKEYPRSIWLDHSAKNHLLKQKCFSNVPDMTLVTVSEWLKKVTQRSFLGTYPIEVIANGIDLEVFRPTNSAKLQEMYQLAGKKVILGVAANWEMRKGLDDMIKIASLLDDSCKVVLVGVPFSKRKHIPDNILCIDKTESKAELAALYSMAHVYVNPSAEETMGMTTVEAMACGTPVIVYDRTAVPEAVTSDTGWIVQYGQTEKLAEIIRSISDKSPFFIPCRQRAGVYEKNKKINQYLDLYQQIFLHRNLI